MADELHHFDRRRNDTNVAALALRVTALEARAERVEMDVAACRREIKANTELTEEIHGKSFEMFDAFTTAKNGVRVITATGNGVMWVAERGKHLVVFLLGIMGVWTLWTTGKLPEWLLKVLG